MKYRDWEDLNDDDGLGEDFYPMVEVPDLADLLADGSIQGRRVG